MNRDSIDVANFLEDTLAETDSVLGREIHAFPKYVSRQSITRFLARYELFKLVLSIPGSIVEAGVFSGAGVFSFAHFSEILEPVHYARKIIGFDTFEGFPELDQTKDAPSATRKKGDFAYRNIESLKRAMTRFDANTHLSHIEKIELVEGDVMLTIPQYVENNPHLVVSLLYLDLDLYEPTLTAIKTLLPRIPKGGIIAFDELNKEIWPGETIAAMEAIGIRQLALKKFPFDSLMSYAIV